jgi:hypothetical protein
VGLEKKILNNAEGGAECGEPESSQKFDEANRVLLRTFNALSLIAPTEVRAAAAEVIEDVEGAPGRFWQVARKDVGLSD